MSHFIQDNQIVVETIDSKFILFIKGGDNNTTNYDNKRLSSWHYQGVYSSETHYMNFISELIMGTISSGSWQFKSLKNKSFNGFKEYENTIYNRFEKAFKNALSLDWKISDVNKENIYQFETEIKSLLRNKNISLLDESGCESSMGLIYRNYYKNDDEQTPEADAVVMLNKENSFFERKSINTYRNFCKKYADSKKENLINNVSFCTEIVSNEAKYDTSVSFLASFSDPIITRDVKFSCFNILVNSSEDTVKRLLSFYYSMEKLLEKYPSQFETITCSSVFKDRVKQVIEKADKYDERKFKENSDKLFNADYSKLRKMKTSKIKEIVDEAKPNFIEKWNELVDRSWYKNTNEQLPRYMKLLEDYLETETFTLEDVKDKCNANFLPIITHHKNQMKKNQPAIKKAFKDLIEQYSILFNVKSLADICEYFGFEKHKVKTDVKQIEIKVEQIREVVKTPPVQLNLFDFAS